MISKMLLLVCQILVINGILDVFRYLQGNLNANKLVISEKFSIKQSASYLYGMLLLLVVGGEANRLAVEKVGVEVP